MDNNSVFESKVDKRIVISSIRDDSDFLSRESDCAGNAACLAEYTDFLCLQLSELDLDLPR